MREIKFRAWDDFDKRMGVVTDICFGNDVGVNFSPDVEFETFEWQDIILMQFTGLKDKNGKEIYEWDIVRSDTGCVGVVQYGGLSFAFVGKQPSGEKYFDTITNPAITEDSTTVVIGNIYENPELLQRVVL